jgi:hypothetical protein
MKTEYYKLEAVEDYGRAGVRKIPAMVRHNNGDWVKREDHERQVQGLVDELADRDRLLCPKCNGECRNNGGGCA